MIKGTDVDANNIIKYANQFSSDNPKRITCYKPDDLKKVKGDIVPGKKITCIWGDDHEGVIDTGYTFTLPHLYPDDGVMIHFTNTNAEREDFDEVYIHIEELISFPEVKEIKIG